MLPFLVRIKIYLEIFEGKANENQETSTGEYLTNDQRERGCS
jgi:hypothetical protein